MSDERIQKVISRLGLASRRAAEEMINQGRISVNGNVSNLGDKVGPEDTLCVDGVVYSSFPDLVVYLLNKPKGIISSVSDDRGRKTVVDLLGLSERIYPVGRLDQDSEGLILLTNDGNLCYRLTHPKFGIEKEYLVHVESKPSPGALRNLRDGVELDDGITAPAKVALVADNILRITIHEGRNRQIRRMCAAVSTPVIRLVRTRIGSITDPHLKPSKFRKLSSDEILALQSDIG